MKEVPTRVSYQLLPQLIQLNISQCGNLTELFVLPPSVRKISVADSTKFQFLWVKGDTESMSVQMEHGNDLKSTTAPEEPARNNSLPWLRNLHISGSENLVALLNVPASLEKINPSSLSRASFVSGQFNVLTELSISGCDKLESLDGLGNLPTLQKLELWRCKLSDILTRPSWGLLCS